MVVTLPSSITLALHSDTLLSTSLALHTCSHSLLCCHSCTEHNKHLKWANSTRHSHAHHCSRLRLHDSRLSVTHSFASSRQLFAQSQLHNPDTHYSTSFHALNSTTSLSTHPSAPLNTSYSLLHSHLCHSKNHQIRSTRRLGRSIP